MYKRLIVKRLSWLILALCLCGCTTKLVYNFLDWGIEWKIGRLIKLNDEQKDFTHAAVQTFHRWHRETQLPRYADYVKGMEARFQQDTPFTADEIHKVTDDVQLFIDDSLNQVMPDIEKLLVSLSDKQVAHFLERLDEEREEYREDYIEISNAKRLKKRKEEFTKYTEKLFGKLTDDQEDWLDAWAKSLKPYEELNAKQQILWQSAIQALLAERARPSGIRSELSELMFYRTDNWQPELQKVMDHNQEITYALLARIFNHLSERQHAKLIRRLQSYQQDFIELSQEG